MVRIMKNALEQARNDAFRDNESSLMHQLN